jgi:hypothetical protein
MAVKAPYVPHVRGLRHVQQLLTPDMVELRLTTYTNLPHREDGERKSNE